MNEAARQVDDERSVSSILVEMAYGELERLSWNREAARLAIVKQIMEGDESFRARALERALDDYVRVVISRALSDANTMVQKRADGVKAREKPSPKQETGLYVLAEQNFNTLYDYLLQSGIRLGQATKQQVMDQAALHGTHETSHRIKRKWLEAVANPMRSNQVVEAVHSLVDLEKLRQKAREGA